MKHSSPISGIATHGETFIATAGYDNQVILWDAASGEPLARGLHDHLANQCAFSSTGRWLASASSDYTARIWSVPQMRMVGLIAGHADDIEMVAFSPDEHLLATCSRDRTVRVSRREGSLVQVLRGHEDDVLSVVWSADGQRLITSSDDGTVREWELATGAELRRIDTGGVQTDTVVADAAGRVYAGDDEGFVTLLRGAAVVRVKAHEAGVKRLVLQEADRLLVSLSYDRSFAVWTLDEDGTPRLRHRDNVQADVWARSAAFLGRDTLVFATFGATYRAYSLPRSAWLDREVAPTPGINAVARLGGHVYTVGDGGTVWRDGQTHQSLGSLMNFLTPAGDMLLTGGQLGQVFDAVSGTLLAQHHSPLNCGASFVREGVLHALIGSYTGEALVLRARPEGGFAQVGCWPLHANAIKGLATNADVVFSVCASGAVAFHSLQDGSLLALHERGHSRIANGCAAMADGFASVGRDLKLRLWRDQRLAETVDTPHEHSIKCISVAADGTTIGTGGYAGHTALYDTLARRWVARARPTAAGISSLYSSGDAGQRFLASSYDGRIYGIG